MVLPLTMQAFPLTILTAGYDPSMRTGRPSSRPRTPFGQRVHAAREALGLSQAEVAAKLGVNQASYGAWERDPVALRPDQVEQLVKILNITAEQLFGTATAKTRGGGPVGKLRQVFEKASQLPRHQQNKVAEFVEAFVAQHLHSPSKVA
jgi:transcriptional regulator with XRE-family HTH domain